MFELVALGFMYGAMLVLSLIIWWFVSLLQ